MSRPRILVTPWRRALPTYLGERTLLDTLDPAYTDRVADAGGLPLIAARPPRGSEDEIAGQLLDLADAVLLSGGGDVDPAAYGAAVEDADDPDPAADAWEVALVRAAARRRVPALGVCRGAQVMAVAFGGRLAQRLAPEWRHVDLAGMAPEQILAERHPVALLPGTRVAEAFAPADRLHVNTIHHHAISDPGALRPTATAAGGLIEAVEPPADGELAGWTALGVQWHPEKMCEPEQRRLFDLLVTAARRQADPNGGAQRP